MKTKLEYNSPEIELIRLDREISLQLASDPNPNGEPDGSGWSSSRATDYFSNDAVRDFSA